MGRVAKRSNFRVEVYPRHPGDIGIMTISGQDQSEKEWENQCKEIARSIERHVDGLPFRGRKTSVIWDTEEVCDYCGCPWTEDKNSPHNGGCCENDLTMFEEDD